MINSMINSNGIQAGVKPEHLLDELREDVQVINGQTWVVNMYVKYPVSINLKSEINSLCNINYVTKKSSIDNHLKHQNYFKVLSMLDSDNEFDWFNNSSEEIYENVGDKKYYKLLSRVLSDKTIGWNKTEETLELIFMGDNPRLMMNKTEAALFSTLPEKFIVWRGVAVEDSEMYNINDYKGISWTLNKHMAIWFATRKSEGKKSILLETEVNKYDVFAYLNCRKEEEIVLDPNYINDLTIKILQQ